VKGNFHARFCHRGGGSDPLVYCNRTAHSAGSVLRRGSVPVGRRSPGALGVIDSCWSETCVVYFANKTRLLREALNMSCPSLLAARSEYWRLEWFVINAIITSPEKLRIRYSTILR
jgi:hypothetical protein